MWKPHDLLTVCTLDGELKYNIYGPRWSDREVRSNRVAYYGQPAFAGDRIFVLYLGGDQYAADGQHSIYPTRFHVFDLEGNYMETLETGHEITGFVYDPDNNRILMSLEHEDLQFAYLDLNE
ncbi:MAG: hypothetical protein LBP25_05695 [Tannerellaceae bacterium]|jgi:hypothetical protein|nr:hypothetical protein [Tannerellaceae bacterium]